jgi:1,2-diacylglycerol 3-alpha-glucosyltransferase
LYLAQQAIIKFEFIMKIGFFTDGFLPQPNGVATSVFASAQELERRGHEVFIVAPKYPGYKDEMNVFRLTSVKVMSKPDLRLALHLPDRPLRRLLKMDFDIIHVHSGGPITLLGLEIAKAKNIPIVATYHTLWAKYTHYFMKGKVIKPKVIEQATKLFCNRCDYLIAPSRRVVEELEKYGIKKPIAMIPSGVDTRKFGVVSKNTFRKKFGIPSSHKIVLTVSRMGEEKSIDFLLRSFALSLKKNPETTFLLVGDGQEKKNLIELSKKLGIEKNVVFSGVIDSINLPEVYGEASLFLFASQTETQGMVILEALASGVPVIAVEDTVFQEVIQNNQNGFLLMKEERVFADKVTELLQNEVERKKLGDGARAGADSYSIQAATQALEDLYKKVLEIRGKETVERIMKKNLSYEELFVTLVSFWATILMVRATLFFAPNVSYPTFLLFGFSIPHIVLGVAMLICLVPFVTKKKELGLFTLLFLGASLGLIFDDFWIFATGGPSNALDYWARGNLVALLLSGVLPAVFVKVLKKNNPVFSEHIYGVPHVNPKNPHITVVIPAYNEEDFIKITLSSIVDQTYKNFELIVVDNNSTDKTGEIAKSFGARVIVEKKKGVAWARQAGFMAAQGSFIVTTDADTVVASDWVEKMAQGFSDEKIVGFGGLNRLYSGPVGSRAATRYLATAFWVIDRIASHGWNLLGSNFGVRKSAFEKINGFNTSLTLGEDVDLSQRLKDVGKVKLDPTLLVYSSGRRFRNGLILGVITYAPSWFMRVVFKKDKFLFFPTIRSEDSLFGKISFLPLVFCVAALVFLFYYANPSIFEAHPLRFLEKLQQVIR